MAARMKTNQGKVTVRGQRSDATAEAGIKLAKVALPWLAWCVLSGFGSLLRLGLYIASRGALLWAGLIALFLCCVIAVFDARLRSHRLSWEGRWIGPVTSLGAGLFFCLYMIIGLATALAIAWLFCGVFACVCWGIWATVGDHRDMAAGFNARAAAAGAPGARMVAVTRAPADGDEDEQVPDRGRGRRQPRPRRDSAPRVTRAGLVLPSDPAMPAGEVAAEVARFEVINRDAVGSWSVTGISADAGLAEVVISDPATLTAEPIRWPGPFAPGADLSVPFRLGVLQTGREFLYPRLPLHHRKTTGKTGVGKTETLCWNMFAEGITRVNYAMWAADLGKGEQYLGACRPALHGLATTPEEAILLLMRAHRARLDRCNYMARDHITEWTPDCRLVFMDMWLEEAVTVLRLLGSGKADMNLGRFMIDDWVDDVAQGRSAGQSWTAGFQRPTKEQAVSAVALSQMGNFCFGVMTEEDARFGLSKEQRERGCRPTMWNTPETRGMFYADTETVPADLKTVPVRGYWWGPGSARIAMHAQEYPASCRPLDDITGEAMTWTPPVSPTSAGPVPGGARSQPLKAVSDKRLSELEAKRKLRAQILTWTQQGMARFSMHDLEMLQLSIGKGRTWYYGAMNELENEATPLVQRCGEKPRAWEIIANLPWEQRPGAQGAGPAEDDEPGDGEEVA